MMDVVIIHHSPENPKTNYNFISSLLLKLLSKLTIQITRTLLSESLTNLLLLQYFQKNQNLLIFSQIFGLFNKKLHSLLIITYSTITKCVNKRIWG